LYNKNKTRNIQRPRVLNYKHDVSMVMQTNNNILIQTVQVSCCFDPRLCALLIHCSVERLRGCLFSVFHHFFISFREIQKLDDPKSEKLEAPFHELLTFGAIQLLDLPKANPKK
jgi:hypothetical protein